MSTLSYYNENAQSFVSNTKDVSFGVIQEKFVSYLRAGARVLDFGCGAGRDTKAFLDKGFDVIPTDGSKELCRLTSEYLGIPVIQLLFQDLDYNEAFDGIWACASILHLKSEELPAVLKRIAEALKSGGVFYTSFKYGDFEGERNGRYFTDVTEETWDKLLSQIPQLETKEIWVSADARAGRENEKWLNIIAVKTGGEK